MKLHPVAHAVALLCGGLSQAQRQFIDHTFMMGGGQLFYVEKANAAMEKARGV